MSEQQKGFNTMAYERAGAYTVQVSKDGKGLAIHYPSANPVRSRSIAGFAPPPHHFRAEREDPSTARLSPSEALFHHGDPSAAPAERSQRAHEKFGETIDGIARNEDLSSAAKTKARREATVLTLRAHGTQYALLEGIRAKLEQRHATLFAPPVADAAASILDVESRSYFKSLQFAEQAAMVKQMEGGLHERLLFALARTPVQFDKRAQPLIDAAWVAHVTRRAPVEVADLLVEEAMCEWARGFVQKLASILVDPNMSGTFGSLNRLEIYKVLRDVGGLGAIGWAGNEAEQYERRAALDAA